MTKQQLLNQIQHCDNLIYRLNNALRKTEVSYAGDCDLAIKQVTDRAKLSRIKTECIDKLSRH